MKYKKCLYLAFFIPSFVIHATKTSVSIFAAPIYRKIIIEKAIEIEKLCPDDNYVVYALGNTPALIVATLQMLEEQKISEKRCHFIAFSGSWLLPTKSIDDVPKESIDSIDLRCFNYSSDLPNEDQIHIYRAYLKKIGLSPTLIMARAQRDIKTAIVDILETGKSLASFLGLLCGWAADLNIPLSKFIDALLFVNLSVYDNCDNYFGFKILNTKEIASSNTALLMPTQEYLIFKQKHVRFASEETIRTRPIEAFKISDFYLLNLLSFARKEQRILPYFSFKEWEQTVPQHYQISSTQQNLLAEIRNDIQADGCPSVTGAAQEYRV